MNITYKGNAKHKGDNIEGNKTVHYGMSKEDREALVACVKENGVSKDDVDRLIEVLKEINISQNDLTTEFTKMSEDLKDYGEKGTKIAVLKGLSLTSDLVTLGQAAIGIATNNPGLALLAVLEAAKEIAK